MDINHLTLRNYRSIGPRGVAIPLQTGFVSFIGVNNSGKSSALRALYELRPLWERFNDFTRYADVGILTALLSPAGYSFGPSTQLLPGERIFSSTNSSSAPRITLQLTGSSPVAEFLRISEVTITLLRNGSTALEFRTPNGLVNRSVRVDEVHQGGRRLHQSTDSEGVVRAFDFVEMARAVGELAHTMYVGPFRNAINSGGSAYYDLQVGTAFNALLDSYMNGQDYRANEAVARMLEELALIFGFSSLSVGVTPEKDALRYTINGRSMRGSELGAGISQFVIVAANLLVRGPRILLIDEPELNLHAGLQMRFLSLLAQFTRGPVLFATHSVGLARSMADRVIAMRNDDNGVAYGQDWQSAGSLSLTLGELGYGGFNDSAFKAVLLVEGVTEVRVLQELLIKWGIRNEVVIAPLGGDTLAAGNRVEELRQLARLSDSVFALVDGEGTQISGKSERRRQFEDECKALSIECLVLERRSMENYLDQDIAREVMRAPGAAPFGVLDKPGREWSWAKDRNWRIAREMHRSSIAGTDLEAFLNRIASVVTSSQ